MRKIICVLVIVIFLTTSFSSFQAIKISNKENMNQLEKQIDDNWHYLPSYSNYAPNGLPDFDQKSQNDWKTRLIIWSFCAPTSLANIFWWFDSKNSDPNGIPGDGIDNYPLVKNLNVADPQIPGPNSDDHNLNNVNIRATKSVSGKPAGELIEQLSWYVNHNNKRTRFGFKGWGGTKISDLKEGIEMWLEDAGLEDDFKIEDKFRPRFSYVCQKVQENCGVIILFHFNIPFFRIFKKMISGHYVSVAGVNQNDGYIALSDPYLNVQNPDPTPDEHRDAAVVSHDIYKIESTQPNVLKASWWCPGYGFTGGYVTYALVISEVNK